MKPIIWDTLGIIWLIITAIGVLLFAKTILIPIALAFFCAFLLRPGVNKLRSIKIPNIAAILIMLLSLIIGIGIVFGAFGYALSTFTDDLPSLKETVGTKVENIDNALFDRFGMHLPIAKKDVQNADNPTAGPLSKLNLGKFFTGTATTIGMIPVVFVLTFFILLYREKFKKFVLKITHGRHRDAMERTIQKVGSVIPAYLIGVITVAAILTVLLFLGLWALGVQSPLFFAIMIALLNIIPYVGTVIGFVVLLVFVILTQSTGIVIGVIALFLVTQFVDNNFLTPLISGRKIDLNPLTSIIGIIAGGVLWGIAGMIIALPMLGILKILCDTIPGLQPFGYLLGNE